MDINTKLQTQMEGKLQDDRHSVSIEKRKKLHLTGIKDVDEFDAETIIADSIMGGIIIKGSGLKIQCLDTDKGILDITGNINGLVYTEEKSKRARKLNIGKLK